MDKPRMICPNCLAGNTEFGDKGWQCVWADCLGFSNVPKYIIPPSPAELEEYWKRKKLKEKIQMFLKSK